MERAGLQAVVLSDVGMVKQRQDKASAQQLPLQTDPPALAAPASLALPGWAGAVPAALALLCQAVPVPVTRVCVLSSVLAALLAVPDLIRTWDFVFKGD